jgi:hypothetical protein
MDLSVFDRMRWLPDRMLLDDLVFCLGHYDRQDWELGDDCFVLVKTERLVRDYARFFASQPDFEARNVFELGIWVGGSLALWHEILRPDRHVAVDALRRGDSGYLRRYVAGRGLEDAIRTYWGTDQADGERLREIVAENFDGPLDFVVDDASHFYGPTKASFEALFPLLRPGGLYVLEDWAWEHWPPYQTPGHPWTEQMGLTRLVQELVEATGSHHRGAVGTLTVYRIFIVVERGPAELPADGGFRLEDFISRRRPGPETGP